MSAPALVALGSNLGDRAARLGAAAAALGRLPRTRLLACSRWRESVPEGAGDGDPYLNGAALLLTGLGPRELLEELLALERRGGRARRRGSRARTLDLDLILYGEQRRHEPDLVLPHPRFRGRAFVLEPAAEVAPGLRDPVSGKTLAQLWTLIRGGLRLGGGECGRRAVHGADLHESA
ncbi:MAG: 2-amino-4-hydroxy-6-hydroxymethyldihydropteridine diphosphokinase [Planctomycetota bacterium]